MTVSSFVLVSRFKEVAAAARKGCVRLSSGRYSLVHPDARKGNVKAGLSLPQPGYPGERGRGARRPGGLRRRVLRTRSRLIAIGDYPKIIAQAKVITETLR